VQRMTTNLEVNYAEADLLLAELYRIIDGDRYFLSPRIQTLRAIRAKIRLEPSPRTPPPLKHYEPPRASAARRRRSAGRFF
jgi:hypothetical protein